MPTNSSDGLAHSRLTRVLCRLGAVAVVLLGIAAVVVFLPAAESWALLVAVFLIAAVVGMVFYGARMASKTATPYWQT
ncbi:hypothetical protein C499_03798 [Halogeometricum borinquense DSM 11551]|uniref:Uncharacterized protein n=2 Tax=Halogeometricum borinquense TaxID=60847 RepID=E4NRR4_HALBP|nr:hypothetical protein [Halogeometricum borinquense]ADQ66851.1 hypothetical protein Hbor_12640 [Halogeometricum borinquense DSM 11551]ELY30359.1 hypothetical protein C499_03798 [Halogeometricum borinquense DSM 11551]RYJ14113.1 hypothetical protein ELS19_09155 [Halogeometricum borinquense]